MFWIFYGSWGEGFHHGHEMHVVKFPICDWSLTGAPTSYYLGVFV